MSCKRASDTRIQPVQLRLPFDPSARERLAMLVRFQTTTTQHTESAK